MLDNTQLYKTSARTLPSRKAVCRCYDRLEPELALDGDGDTKPLPVALSRGVGLILTDRRDDPDDRRVANDDLLDMRKVGPDVFEFLRKRLPVPILHRVGSAMPNLPHADDETDRIPHILFVS